MSWEAIKTEYITTDIGYRELAKKHGVSVRQLSRIAKAEDWVTERQQYVTTVSTKCLQKHEEVAVSDAEEMARLLSSARLKLCRAVERKAEEEMQPADLHRLANTIKVLSEDDKNIRQEISITWADGMDEYGD